MGRRIERVNNLIRQEISELLQRQAKDPRLGNFIAITGVYTTADLRYAKIFVSSINSDEEKQQTLRALASASPFFRKEMAKTLRLRHIPELSFHWDDSIERGDRLLHLLDQISSEDH